MENLQDADNSQHYRSIVAAEFQPQYESCSSELPGQPDLNFRTEGRRRQVYQQLDENIMNQGIKVRNENLYNMMQMNLERENEQQRRQQ